MPEAVGVLGCDATCKQRVGPWLGPEYASLGHAAVLAMTSVNRGSGADHSVRVCVHRMKDRHRDILKTRVNGSAFKSFNLISTIYTNKNQIAKAPSELRGRPTSWMTLTVRQGDRAPFFLSWWVRSYYLSSQERLAGQPTYFSKFVGWPN